MKHYSVEWYDDHFLAVFPAVVEVGDVLRAIDQWIADPRFDDIDFFIDLGAVVRIDYTEQDFQMTANYSAVGEQWRRGKPLRIGLVVPNMEIEQQVRHYVSVTVDHSERGVFYSRDEAIRWGRGPGSHGDTARPAQ
jgi:hypothetical protein